MSEEIFKEEGLKYLETGLKILPCRQKSKEPSYNWKGVNFNTEKSLEFFKKSNIALKLGDESKVIMLDIDTEDKEILEKVSKLINYSPCERVGNPKRMPARFFKYNGEENKTFKNIHVEIISTGRYAVIPPSIHPKTNEPYKWVGRDLISSLDDLPDLSKEAIDALEDLDNECRRVRENAGEAVEITPRIGMHGANSHTKLSEIVTASVLSGKSFEETYRLIDNYDRKFNKKCSYFGSPYRRDQKGLTREAGILKFVSECYINKIKNRELTDVKLMEKPLVPTDLKIEVKEVAPPPKKVDFKYKKLPKLEGYAGELFDIIYKCSRVKRSQFAFAATNAVMSTLIGGDVHFDMAFGNLYQYILGRSGSGKSGIINGARDIILDYGPKGVLGGSKISSENVILNSLDRNPNLIYIVDEAGDMLNKIKENRVYGVGDTLTDLFGLGGSNVSGKTTTDSKKQGFNKTIGRVYSPYVNLFLGSTIKAFEGSFDRGLFDTGFGGRFLYYFEDRPKGAEESIDKIKDHEEELRRICGQVRSVETSQTIEQKLKEMEGQLTGDSVEVKWQRPLREVNPGIKAKNFLSEVRRDCDKRRDQKIEEGQHVNGLEEREFLFIKKLALHHHFSLYGKSSVDKELDRDSLQWGVNAMSTILNNCTVHLSETLSDGEFDRVQRKIYGVIQSRTQKGKKVTKKCISNYLRKIRIQLRNEAFMALVQGGFVGIDEDKNLYIAKELND